MVFEADTGIEEISVWDPTGRLILELEVNEIDEVGLSEMTFVFSPVEDEFEEEEWEDKWPFILDKIA
jgi:hypothetical protein